MDEELRAIIAADLERLKRAQDKARKARLVNDHGHIYFQGALTAPPRPAGAMRAARQVVAA